MTAEIAYHPETSLLRLYLNGSLPMGVNVAVAAHVENCAVCSQKLDELLAMEGDGWFSEGSDQYDVDLTSIEEAVFQRQSTAIDMEETAAAKSVEIGGRSVRLPSVLASIYSSSLSWKAPTRGINQTALELDKQTLTKFVYMEPGSTVPLHSHFGNEYMLVLEGNLSDELGAYGPSDFVARDKQHTHSQFTEEGCVCLFVTDAPLLFKEGLLRLLNPSSRFTTWIKRIRDNAKQ